jgi:hypothetical protein
MAWVRIDDGAMQHPKILALSDSAFRLWVRGLCYCQANLTDGLLPAAIVREMKAKRADVDTMTRPLAGTYAPLWEVVDGFGFKVHDYLFWNDSREKVRQRQAKTKARKEKWNTEHQQERDRNAVTERVPNAVQNTPLTKPNQTKPIKEHERARDAGSSLERVTDAFRSHWKRLYGHESTLTLNHLQVMQLEQHVEKIGEASFLAAMAAFFATDDAYVRKSRHPLGLLLRDPTRFLATEAPVRSSGIPSVEETRDAQRRLREQAS